MPLEQTDMNVGFNSGADKVIFSPLRPGIPGQELIVLRISGSQA